MAGQPKLDVIIFGATGFTGKCVLIQFIKLNRHKYSFAVAGRSYKKLKEVLGWAAVETGEDIANIRIITADCFDKNSLNSMVSQCKIIINCCGPYILYGEPVVQACIENGTHHLDMSGEPEYMEMIQLNYHELAESKQVYIVSACGFDSVPADLGVIHFVKNFEGIVNSIESHVLVKSSLPSNEPLTNIGTWKSIVYSITSRKNRRPLREKLLQRFNRPILEPRLKPRWIPHQSPAFDNKIGVPFPGSDKSVVYRTQNFLYKEYGQRPVQYCPYFVINSFTFLIGLALMGFFLLSFGHFKWGQQLLLRYPEFFSLGCISRIGPSEQARISTTACVRFEGEGWTADVANSFQQQHKINLPTNKKMITEISFSDIGYGFTATAIILGAFTILNESEFMPLVVSGVSVWIGKPYSGDRNCCDQPKRYMRERPILKIEWTNEASKFIKLPTLKGGVYTPGGAFSRTSYLEQLQDNGFSIRVLES